MNALKFIPGLLIPALLLFVEPNNSRAEFDGLAEAFKAEAPQILDTLRKNKCQNIGVLKFSVEIKDTPQPSYNVGELNIKLAGRLEVALVLALNPNDPVPGIVRDVSGTVAQKKDPHPNHLTREGRQAFFKHKYDLAWGTEQITPDQFIAGTASIGKDFKQMSVQLQTFDKTGTVSNLGKPIVASIDPNTFAEAGYSYLLSQSKLDEVVKAPTEKKKKQTNLVLQEEVRTEQLVFNDAKPSRHPAIEKSLVKLTLMYNDRPVEIEGDRVPEPKVGDKVSFKLENNSERPCGVVLKVNGENTLFRERFPNDQCLKWILMPGKSVEIKGFQTGEKESKAFQVLSTKESAEKEVNYGNDAGLFQMAVFTGQIVDKEPEEAVVVKKDATPEEIKFQKDDQAALISVKRGILDLADIHPSSLKELQKNLRGREQTGPGKRGLVAEGKASGEKAVQRVFFKQDAEFPTNLISVRYYSKKQ